MKKKYFSLIHNDDIKEAPSQKILPPETFSELIDGKELLEKVKEDALKYRNSISIECETLKSTAEAQGFEVGFEKWTEKLAELEQVIRESKESIENIVTPIALQAAKKIVSTELQQDENAILRIVKGILKPVITHKKIVIYANEEELETLEKEKEQIKSLFESLQSFSLRAGEDVEKGGVVIETEGGIINARLTHRWEILEQAFESFAKQSN